jgi:hypothetical protein
MHSLSLACRGVCCSPLGCVGKTSLVLRYCQNTFNADHITTIQASFLRKRLNIGSARVNLAIWDTAGQERFHALGPIYYRDANGMPLARTHTHTHTHTCTLYGAIDPRSGWLVA